MNQKELLKNMENLVERDVHFYKSDFYDFDVDTIKKMKDKEKRWWLTRDSGTWLLKYDRPDSLTVAEYYSETDAKYYYLERDGEDYNLKPVTAEKCLGIIKDRLKDIENFEVFVINNQGYKDTFKIQAYGRKDCERILHEDYKVQKIDYIICV